MSDDTADTPPAQPRRRARLAAIVTGAVILLAAAGGTGAYLLTPDKPTTVTIIGTMTLLPAAFNPAYPGTPCTGGVGYDDIAQGTDVVVRDAAGKVIGTGQLGAGSVRGTYCVFWFTVSEVPQETFYGVEISHRGVMTYTADQVKRPLEVALGS